MYELLQVVRVLRALPAQAVEAGAIGAIVAVFDAPEPAYEVEFVDSNGRTIAIATLKDHELRAEPARDAR